MKTTTHNRDANKMLEDAVAFATAAHTGQVDKVGQPYIYHPLRVGMALAHQGFAPVQVCAAFLHDVVEDTPTTLREIEGRFGRRVCELVDAMSHRAGEGYRTYIRRLALVPGAASIKLEDLADNFFPGRGYEAHPATVSKARWAKRHLERVVGYSRLIRPGDPAWQTTWN